MNAETTSTGGWVGPRFEVYAQWRLPRRQRWYWRLVASNGEIVAASEAYSSAHNARRGAQAVQHLLAGGTLPVLEADAA